MIALRQTSFLDERQPLRVVAPPLPTPKGETYDEALDGERLGRQCQSVLDCMSDGRWRSLRDIANETGEPEASISARLRDLDHWNGWRKHRQRVAGGLWHYRLVRET